MLLIGPDDSFNRMLSEKIGAGLVLMERRVFPDGEVCPRVMNEVRGSDIVLSLRMKAGKCKPNEYLLEMLFTIRNLKEHMNAGDITLIIPYFPYARQDAIFRLGEPLSSKYVAELLEASGISRVISVTVHLHRIDSFSNLFNKAYVINLSGFKSLADRLRLLDLKDPFILGPDTESINWARELAESYEVEEYDAFTKERDVQTGEIKTTVKKIDLSGRDVVVVDDMVSTGGTMANAVKAAKKMGARFVVSTFVHPVLAPGSIDKIIGAGADAIIASDTIEWVGSKASVVPTIAEALR